MLLQALPQTIHLTVQQPPGLPFWQTVIISAVAGTFFGLASSVAMEFIKPAISSRLLKKTVLKNLDKEFCENYGALLDAVELVSAYESAPEVVKQDITDVVQELAGSITKERFTHYKETQKATFYEADEGYRLGKFYVLLERAFQQFPNNRDLLPVAVRFGEEHAKLRGLPEIKPLGIFVDAFKVLKTTHGRCDVKPTANH
jgi:hypothetical protein